MRTHLIFLKYTFVTPLFKPWDISLDGHDFNIAFSKYFTPFYISNADYKI